MRVENYHRNTLIALTELAAAAGLSHPSDLRPSHFLRRTSADRVIAFDHQYERLVDGELLTAHDLTSVIGQAFARASADTFAQTA